MNKYMLSVFVLLIALSGCSTDSGSFNDKDIRFKLVDKQLNSDSRSYSIEIKNSSKFQLTHLHLNLSYPIKQISGAKNNPFVVEGKTEKRPVHLNSDETANFTIFAPIKEVFANSNTIDIEHPDIELQGFVKAGKQEIPFQIAGELEAIIGEW
ncbi:hypothetical protein N0M98_23180 [Paenibacillus doosanensis]|uniref:Late embryogenesis abundant protein LEA-2 subgroup domain-containing protein n=1 Tax=Paenibacillus konkukensis TaxID=2020716 RepID=A0ABY4RNN3_9BACL|nr:MULTISPECIES: hypothetical protein [Paenibacillus]MCS7463035.1 hypothetical protein [Paenibacillus doosanensis]UQZ83039.1 hypothetical protein SK3146_02200 [Paenibacillus konkukensis]